MSEARDVQLPPVQQELKVDSRALIRDFGGQVACAEFFERAQSRYSDAGSVGTRVFLSIHEVAELEDRTAGRPGFPVVTRGMARRQGFELVSRPRALPGPEDLLACAGQLAREGGDVMTTIGNALIDRHVTRKEALGIRAEIDQLIQVAVTLAAAVDAIAEGDG